MTEQNWTEQNLAAFIFGGLTEPEAERLLAQTQVNPELAASLSELRELDAAMNDLFASVQPDATLEDHVVKTLRKSLAVQTKPRPLSRRLFAPIAALVLVGVLGAMVASIGRNGSLPMPGEVSLETARYEASGRVVEEASLRDQSNEADRQRSVLNAALPGIARSDDRLADDKPQAPPPGSATWNGTGMGAPQDSNGAAAFQPKYGNPYYRYVPPGVPSPTPGRGNSGYFVPGMSGGGADGTASSTQPTGEAQPTKPAEPRPKTVTEEPKPKADDSGTPAPPDPATSRRIIIRSGEIEFEIESFDSAAATVTKLVSDLKGAFVATINSEKLPNGKVKGSITVRTPPEFLDRLVLDLRRELGKGGELKGVRIASSDITKQYTDLESRLRAARTMETRLLQIIKEGKGEIKQLLEAEKELGVWRTRIEEVEGELRYYSNLVSLSTLTITLVEKEIRAATGIVESEQVQAGVEVEDVDKAYQQVLAAVADAKGRMIKSEVKQLTAGQYNATLNFEVSPEASGPLRDRLQKLGRVARLEIDRGQKAEGGTAPKDAKIKRGDTLFFVQLYNLANIAPRETAVLQVAVLDVPVAYQSLRDAVAKAKGRILVSQLNEQDHQNVTAQFDFEIKRSEDAGFRASLDSTGEVVSRQVSRGVETNDVTDTKVLYRTTLVSAARLKPRETTTLSLEVVDVDQTATLLAAETTGMKGRQLDGQFTRERSGKVTAKLAYEVPLASASGLVDRFKAAGTVRIHQSFRDPQAPEGKFATARIDVTLTSSDRIVADDEGLWPPVRKGLSYSASVLLTSVTWVIFGLCVVLPWVLIAYAGYKAGRWMFRSESATKPVTTAVTMAEPSPESPES